MTDEMTSSRPHQRLWYKTPARDWLEGLPIGTGRLAAMVLGSYKRERIALNHEWLWKGEHRERDNKPKAHLLAGVRELLLAGNYEEGTKQGADAFGCASPDEPDHRVDPYQPAGDLYLEFTHSYRSSYRRELDLSTAAVTVDYRAGARRGSLNFKRETIAHLKEDLILVRVTAAGEPFDCALWLDRNPDAGCDLSFTTSECQLTMNGDIRNGIEFCVEASLWHTDGTAEVFDGRKVMVSQARELIVAVNVGTSVGEQSAKEECVAKRLKGAPDWKTLFKSHVEEHAKHYGSCELDLSLEEPDLPTDERMQAVRGGARDPGRMLLYYNYGRYLLSASSANAVLPANLQGKWNEDMYPPWDCDYHHDINLQMNYWPAEPGGMQAYAEALLQHIERCIPHGKKAARDLYGCRGVWYPIQTDPWGRCTPESKGWAAWIGSAAWLGQHMWWHYEYGQDETFLRERAYPFLKEVATFYEDYLIADEQGQLQIVPSQSPENRFVDSADAGPVSLCVSATMDVQFVMETLQHCIRAGEILDMDGDRRAVWANMLARLPRMKVGTKGQLLEWNEEFEEAEPGHRHTSHLFGLFPGELITPDRTPDLFAAARKSLELRLASKGGHTGWSRAWTSCCFARLGDGEKAFEHLQYLVTDFATDTMLNLHPPRIFQIEGNLGGSACVMEMLLQSYHEELHFLPALPSQWPEGQVRGLRARGGFTVNVDWKDGRLTRAEITATVDNQCKLKVASDAAWTLTTEAGDSVTVEQRAGLLTFAAQADIRYVVLAL